MIKIRKKDLGRSIQGSAVLPGPHGVKKERTGVRVASGSSESIVTLPFLFIVGFIPLFWAAAPAPAQRAADVPLPPISQLLPEVRDSQYQSDKVRENYSYTSEQITEEVDGNGQVKKTETIESQDFFVNSHVIERTVKRDGKPLDYRDQQKEADRVTRLVDKAEKTPPGQPLEGLNTNISRIPQ